MQSLALQGAALAVKAEAKVPAALETAEAAEPPEQSHPSDAALQVLRQCACFLMRLAAHNQPERLASAVQEADALLGAGRHAEARLALLRFLEGRGKDVALRLALVRACLALGPRHAAEAVQHARHAPLMCTLLATLPFLGDPALLGVREGSGGAAP